MKGGGVEEIEASFATVVFIAVAIFLTLFVNDVLKNFGGGVKTQVEQLQAIEAAHIIENCFSDPTGKISAEFLSENNGKTIEEICDIKNPKIEADIKNIITGDSWVFGDSIQAISPNERSYKHHLIWVPITSRKVIDDQEQIIMKNGEKYKVKSSKVLPSYSSGINVYGIVLEIEKSSGSEEGLQEFTLTEQNLDDFNSEINKDNSLFVTTQRDVYAKDIKIHVGIRTLSLGESIFECSNSLKLCIIASGKEQTDVGRLHVAI
jgi:hypothetical protein